MTLVGFKWSTQSAKTAMQAGHVEFCRWALASGCPLGDLTATDALTHDLGPADALATTKWLRSLGCPWHDMRCKFASIFAAAAARGNIQVAQWALSEKCPRPRATEPLYLLAADGGHLPFAQWIRKHFPEFPLQGDVLSAAARNGYLAFAKWARSQGAPWMSSSVTRRPSPVHAAVQGGHFEFAQWAADDGCPYGDDLNVENSLRTFRTSEGTSEGTSGCTSTSEGTSDNNVPQFVRRHNHVVVGSF
jgi:hypothetical protein